jgi:hypothetical protein
MILQCKCQNEYQDKKYGKNMRVHTPIKKENMFRCTICKNEKLK